MQNPTQEELTAFFNSIKSSVNGKIVLVGKPTFIDQSRDPAPKHIPDEDIKRRYDPANSTPQGGGPGGPGGGNRTPPTPRPNALTNAQVSDQVDKFLIDNNVLVRVNESQLDRGAVRAFNNRTFDITKVVPTVVMRNEDFGRISRLLEHKTPVKLEFDLRSRIVPEGTTSYNMDHRLAVHFLDHLLWRNAGGIKLCIPHPAAVRGDRCVRVSVCFLRDPAIGAQPTKNIRHLRR